MNEDYSHHSDKPDLISTEFVGRESELAILRASVDRAVNDNSGGLCLVRGTLGVGKTTLVDQLANYADEVKCRVYWGRCFEDSSAPPLWAWVQILRKLITAAELELLKKTHPLEIQRLAAYLPEFAHWEPAQDPIPTSSDESERFLLLDSIATIITEAATRNPLLLILEDFQWIDSPSITLLEILLRPPAAQNISIVVTARDDPFAIAAADVAALLAPVGTYSAVTVEPLSGRDSAKLLNLLTERTVEEATVDEVYIVTGGNPLFIREIASSWGDSEVPKQITLPTSAVESVRSRLLDISVDHARIMEVASAIGSEFDYSRLAAIEHDQTTDQLAAALRSGLDAGFIEESGDTPGWFIFTHQMVRQAIYTSLSTTERASLHARAASGLEQLLSESNFDNAAEISSHWQRAGISGDMGHAATWALRAGKQALAVFSYESAFRSFKQALEAGNQLNDPDVQSSAMAGLGRSLGPLGRDAEAVDYLTQAFDRYVESNDIQKAVKVAQVMFTGSSGQIAMAPIYERALALEGLSASDAAKIKAPLGRVVGIELGDYGRGRELLESSLNTARNFNDHRTVMVALGYLVQVAAFSNKFTECEMFCEQVLELEARLEDPYTISTAALLLSHLRFRDGRLQESSALLKRAQDAAYRTGNKIRISTGYIFEQITAVYSCQWDRAQRAASMSDRSIPGFSRAVALDATAKFVTGNTEAGDKALLLYLNLPEEERRSPEAPDAQHFPLIARSTRNQAHLEMVKDAVARYETSSSGFVRMRGVVAHGWVTIEERDVDVARIVLDKLSSMELSSADRSVMPSLMHLTGAHKAAVDQYESLIETLHRTGLSLEEAWARFEFARLLTEQPTLRPKLSPKKYTTEARTFALGLGLHPLVDRIDELLATQGAPRTLFDLTKREIEVLALVVHGSTNNEIADQLIVSPHTVNRHMGNLFGKLGVNNRAAATDIAHQAGLV
jgi:DNA-binding CsgD family transcriptional regulator/tetratricopeptide (TPR) repeat protein